jgi:hypothetical protein
VSPLLAVCVELDVLCEQCDSSVIAVSCVSSDDPSRESGVSAVSCDSGDKREQREGSECCVLGKERGVW